MNGITYRLSYQNDKDEPLELLDAFHLTLQDKTLDGYRIDGKLKFA
jgi:hypothetical protein